MFGTLVANDLPGFLARGFARNDLVAFIHVPKTAGSSLSAELRRHFAPYVNIVVDYLDTERNITDRRLDVLDRFVASAGLNRPRSCSGHIMYGLLRDRRRELAPLRFVTMLRDPVARVVSDYRYARTPLHPQHAEFAARFPGIEAYVDAALSHDKQARFILPHPRMPPDEAIGFLNESYAFVGTVEQYDASLGLLFRMAGIEAPPSERQRETPSIAGNEVVVTEALRERILAVNRLDSALHAHVSATLARHLTAWQALAA